MKSIGSYFKRFGTGTATMFKRLGYAFYILAHPFDGFFDLKNDPWEKNNFYDIAGYEEITARLRQKLFALRDEWEDESTIFGQQYWQQWRQYDEAAVHGVGRPKGSNMANQVKDWGTDKK